jgi:type IV secretion/conjugal transfer VirB4 family ATPase
MDLLTLMVGGAAGAAGASLMRSLRDGSRPGEIGLADKIGWRALVDERGDEGQGRHAFIEMKDGALMAGWRYRGPDLDADTEEGLELLSQRVNFALLPYVDSWMFHVDAIHRPAPGYTPAGAFRDPVTRAIDEERRAAYLQSGGNFETDHYLIATYLPPHDAFSRLGELLVTRPRREQVDAEYALILDRFWGYLRELESRFPSVIRLERLDADQLLTHLHTCLTGKSHSVAVPEDASDLTRVLVDEDLWGGFEPVVGGMAFRVVGITDFPLRSRPGLLDDLNKLSLPYRFSSRLIPIGPAEAQKRIRWQTKGFARKARPAAQQFRDSNKDVAGRDVRDEFFADQHSIRMALDSSDAAALAEGGSVRFCYYTPAVVVWGQDEGEATLIAREIVEVLNDKGLTAKIEDVNALDAFAGTLPGHGHYNVRKPLVHTKNIANLLPLTSKWPGLRENPCPFYPPDSPPLLWGRTDGCVPIRVSWHVSPRDVGHHLVIAPTGMGKSFLLNLMIAQFRRYPRAQVFHIDNGYSGYALCRAAGGTHYDLCSAKPDAVCFQPLAEIESPEGRARAARWLDVVWDVQGLELTPEMREGVRDALRLIGRMPRHERTLTQLFFQLQNDRLRSAVGYYTAEFGNYGQLLDSAHDDLRDGSYQVFEVKHLLAFRDDKISAPVLAYVFGGITGRLDGRPTYIAVDEGRMAMTEGRFAEQVAEWSVTVRKDNAAVGLATQDPSDLADSPYRAQLMESYPVHFFLPNPRMTEDGRGQYASMGLNAREIEIVRTSQPQRHVYYKTPLGSRLFELTPGPLTHAFLSTPEGKSNAELRTMVDQVAAEFGEAWPAEWLRRLGLRPWAEFLEAEYINKQEMDDETLDLFAEMAQ